MAAIVVLVVFLAFGSAAEAEHARAACMRTGYVVQCDHDARDAWAQWRVRNE